MTCLEIRKRVTCQFAYSLESRRHDMWICLNWHGSFLPNCVGQHPALYLRVYIYTYVCFTAPPTQVPKKWNPLWMILLMPQQCGMQWTSLRPEKLGLINLLNWQGYMHPCTQLSQATDIHVHLRHHQWLLWCLHFRAKSRSDVSCKFIDSYMHVYVMLSSKLAVFWLAPMPNIS